MPLHIKKPNVSVAYLTGSQKVYKNNVFSDEKMSGKSRSIGQMFFKPYDSKEEFIYCARHLVVPMAALGLVILKPILLVCLPIAVLGITLILHGLANMANLWGFDNAGSILMTVAQEVVDHFFQLVVDTVLLPISAVAMITRGISTGLDAVGKAVGIIEPEANNFSNYFSSSL